MTADRFDRVSRRRVLLAGTAAVTGLAGCQTGGPAGRNGDDGRTTTGRSRDSGGDGSGDADHARAENGDTSDGAGTTTETATPRERPNTIFVDAASGTGGVGTADDPMGRLQRAVEAARPGTTVQVRPGEYREKLTTVRSGEPGAPITITGPAEAVVRGSRSDYGIVRIHHSHVHLRGLTLEGLLDPDHPDRLRSYIDGQLIQTRPPHQTDEYLEDIVLAPHNIGYSRKSLIGLERTKNAEIGPLRVTGLAGADYLVGNEDDHNGELFYIGTALSNLGTDWHPWTDHDRTRNVRIHHIDNSAGHGHAEAVDFKEGTADITVEYLTDRGGGRVSDDDTPAAISFKSHGGTARWCDIGDAPVAVEFDFDHPDLAHDNHLYGNRIHAAGEAAVLAGGEPLAALSADELDRFAGTGSLACGNEIEGVETHPAQTGCPADLPTSETLGHLGGESPWA